MTDRSAEELVEMADGVFKETNLTTKGGLISTLDEPLITYLKRKEVPQYFFKQGVKGLRIINDGSIQYPYLSPSISNKGGGRQYLLVTNHRLLFVGGKELNETNRGTKDRIKTFEYKNLSNIEIETASLKRHGKIKFVYNGDDYFFHANKYIDKIEAAKSYIVKKVNNAPIRIPSEKEQKQEERDAKKKEEKEQKQEERDAKKKEIKANSSDQNLPSSQSKDKYSDNENLPDTPEELIQTMSGSTDRDVTQNKFLQVVRNMSPYDFEKFVAKIWEMQGWNSKVTKSSTDRGVDVVAVKNDALEQRRHLIQAKRHGQNTKVGSKDVQQYASLYQRDEQVDNVFIVTSNVFTNEAKAVAKKRKVSLVDSDDIYNMISGR